MSQYPPDPNAPQGWNPPGQQPGWGAPPPGPPGPPGDPGWGAQPPGGYGQPPPGPSYNQYSGGPPMSGGGGSGGSKTLPIVLLVIVVIAAAGAGFVLYSQSGGDDSPEDTVQSYFDAGKDGDCGRMIELIAPSSIEAADFTSTEARAACQESIDTAREAGQLPAELVANEVLSESGDNATVRLETRTSGGDSSENELDLVKVDGDWLIDFASVGSTDGPDDPTTSTTEGTTPSTTEGTTSTTEATTTSTTAGGTTGTTNTFGYTQEQLDTLEGSCTGGDMAACDELYYNTSLGSAQETVGKTCGGRDPAATHFGDCTDDF